MGPPRQNCIGLVASKRVQYWQLLARGVVNRQFMFVNNDLADALDRVLHAVVCRWFPCAKRFEGRVYFVTTMPVGVDCICIG